MRVDSRPTRKKVQNELTNPARVGQQLNGLTHINEKVIILFFLQKKHISLTHYYCSVTLFYLKINKFNVPKKSMFYFNHLRKLILKIRVDLVLSKVLHLIFFHKN